MDENDFTADDKTISATVRKLEIIGEAAKQIPVHIKQKYPQVPWKEMAGMRDKLIHFYFGLDYHLIWKTVTQRLPPLQAEIQKILETHRLS